MAMEINIEPQLIKADWRLMIAALSVLSTNSISKMCAAFTWSRNHAAGFIRAWHGHKKEAKYVLVVKGSALVCAVGIDNWVNPSKH
jgi:dTDP-4-dehydrorhamnose 3,5-epimerase-like enzyme